LMDLARCRCCGTHSWTPIDLAMIQDSVLTTSGCQGSLRDPMARARATLNIGSDGRADKREIWGSGPSSSSAQGPLFLRSRHWSRRSYIFVIRFRG
jgi:hypothetical protein